MNYAFSVFSSARSPRVCAGLTRPRRGARTQAEGPCSPELRTGGESSCCVGQCQEEGHGGSPERWDPVCRPRRPRELTQAGATQGGGEGGRRASGAANTGKGRRADRNWKNLGCCGVGWGEREGGQAGLREGRAFGRTMCEDPAESCHLPVC